MCSLIVRVGLLTITLWAEGSSLEIPGPSPYSSKKLFDGDSCLTITDQLKGF